jgi:hypothetical protein
MNENSIHNKSIIELIEEVVDTAKKERWPMMYDTLADAFYWTKSKIGEGAKLIQLSRETAFYVTPAGEMDGIFIQPFRNNFLTENQDVSAITDFFEKKNGDEMLTMSRMQEEKIQPFIVGFSESIKKDIYRDALEANYSRKDLQNVVDAAFAE